MIIKSDVYMFKDEKKASQAYTTVLINSIKAICERYEKDYKDIAIVEDPFYIKKVDNCESVAIIDRQDLSILAVFYIKPCQDLISLLDLIEWYQSDIQLYKGVKRDRYIFDDDLVLIINDEVRHYYTGEMVKIIDLVKTHYVLEDTKELIDPTDIAHVIMNYEFITDSVGKKESSKV